MSLSWKFLEDGILSKLWAEKYLIIASLTLIFTSNDSANLRNFKKTENFQQISLLNLITVNILKKSEYWLNIQPVSVSVSRRVPNNIMYLCSTMGRPPRPFHEWEGGRSDGRTNKAVDFLIVDALLSLLRPILRSRRALLI